MPLVFVMLYLLNVSDEKKGIHNSREPFCIGEEKVLGRGQGLGYRVSQVSATKRRKGLRCSKQGIQREKNHSLMECKLSPLLR